MAFGLLRFRFSRSGSLFAYFDMAYSGVSSSLFWKAFSTPQPANEQYVRPPPPPACFACSFLFTGQFLSCRGVNISRQGFQMLQAEPVLHEGLMLGGESRAVLPCGSPALSPSHGHNLSNKAVATGCHQVSPSRRREFQPLS